MRPRFEPAMCVSRRRTSDAVHILKLLVEGRFPRIWMPSSQVRDLRQLLLQRYKLVMIRARVKNELQHLCLNQLSPWQTGGQVSGTDSARALLGRKAEAGSHHQAGQPHAVVRYRV